MKTIYFKEQLSFDDIAPLSDNEITNKKSEMLSKLNACAQNNYKMSKSLYNEIISSNVQPNIYSILLDHVRAFNLTFDRCYKNDDDVVRIDAVEVYKKLLNSKSVFFIGLSLICLKLEAERCIVESYKTEAKFIYDMCASLTIDFLKECDNKDFIYSFINFSQINWDDFFDFLLKFVETCDVDDKFLWEEIVKNKRLNKKNMCILLKEKIVLLLMYLIYCKTKFNGRDKKRIEYFLRFEEVQDEIKKIDLNFYETKIKPILIRDWIDIDEQNIKKIFKGLESELKNILSVYSYNNEDKDADLQISLFSMKEENEAPAKEEKAGEKKVFKWSIKKDEES